MKRTKNNELISLCLEKGLTICTAESCTGGLVASSLVEVPGASGAFLGGIVSYVNRIKEELLGVSGSDIEKYTAVSAAVAEQMARGAAERFRADASVSVTGLAGPGGGTDEIPVGRVYIGTFFRGSVFVSEFTFSGDRAEIRRAAAAAALDRLLTAVSGQDL